MEKHTEFGPLVMEEIGKTWIQLCLSKNHTLRQVFWDIRPTLNMENWEIGEIGMSYAELKAVTKKIVLR